MKLHTADKQPQWQAIPKEEWNFWQKGAAATAGILTPANVIDVIGLALVTKGLKDIRNGNRLRGWLGLGLGRLTDNIDGFIADKTGTKSPLGEAVDAGLDKIELLDGLRTMYVTGDMPLEVIVPMAARDSLQAVVSLIAKYRGVTIHPSLEGKWGTFAEWSTIGMFEASVIAADHGSSRLASDLEIVGYVLNSAFLQYGGKSALDYTRQAVGPAE